MSKILQIIKKGTVKTAKIGLVGASAFGFLLNASNNEARIYQPNLSMRAQSSNVLADTIGIFYKITQPENLLTSNNDKRSAEVMFTEIRDELVKNQVIADVLAKENEDITAEDRKEVIQEIIDVMCEKGNIPTRSFESFDYAEDNNDYTTESLNGYYSTWKLNESVLYNEDSVKVKQGYIITEDNNIRDMIITTIHEMVHAIQYENMYINENTSEFDKTLLRTYNNFELNNRYESTFTESMAFMISNEIVKDIYKENGEPTHNFKLTLERSMNEAVSHLYGATPIDDGGSEYVQDQAYEDYENDISGYNRMTLEEVYMANYKQMLLECGIDYEGINLEDTAYYKVFEAFISEEVRDVRYVDYVNNNYKIKYHDVINTIKYYNKHFNENTPGNLAFSMADILSMLRYDGEDYSLEERNEMAKYILENLDGLEEKYVIKYGLQDCKEVAMEIYTVSYSSENIEIVENNR